MNIPIFKLKTVVPIVKEEFVSFFGMVYRVPKMEYGERTTLVAVNLGGALIPATISFYLLWKMPAARASRHVRWRVSKRYNSSPSCLSTTSAKLIREN